MKNIKIITLTIAGITAFSLLQVAKADIPIAKSWYIEGSFGLTNTNQHNSDDDENASDRALGFNVNAGYKFMPFFGAELGYTSYGTSSSGLTGINAYDVAARAIIPFQEVGAEIFAKLGAAYITGNSNDDSSNQNTTDLYYAIGADYYLTSHMAMLVQWSQARKSGGNLDLFSVGFSYLL